MTINLSKSSPAEINAAVFDRNGREILPGDTLRVFHFFGPRRKRIFMYKWVAEVVELGEGKNKFLKVSHLSTTRPEHYFEWMNGRQLDTVEIVQGYGPHGVCFDRRPKIFPTIPQITLLRAAGVTVEE